MPTCDKCGITQATVEMRRSPKKRKGETVWLCKEREACKFRRAAKRANEIANRKGLKKSDKAPEQSPQEDRPVSRRRRS